MSVFLNPRPFTRYRGRPASQRGFNFMELLIAIVVFAVGMLALAQFQGSLTRSAADANARTMAYNIAEEIIEHRRGFGSLASDPGSGIPAFEEIVDSGWSTQRGAVQFTVTEEVTDYFFDRDTDAFSTTDNTGKVYADMKALTVTVIWSAASGQSFAIDDTQSVATSALGSGSIQVSTLIKSTTTGAGANLLTQNADPIVAPLSPYVPGSNPDVISLRIGDNKFKESLTPQPEVVSEDELVETKFDVITYTQSTDNSIFLRREEFRIVSCQCVLQAPPVHADSGGLRPTLWAGDEYDEGERVAKASGTSANSQQSQFCSVCCRDHHDGGAGARDQADDPGRSLYDPWRAAEDYWADGTFAGDHKHYSRDRRGNLVLADQAGDVYYENCRLVRKDGFFRVAQDIRREGMNIFPMDFLDQGSEVSTYSDYVVGAVQAFEQSLSDGYQSASPAPQLSPPASGTFPQTTTLPINPYGTLLSQQQLRSRGIYVDFLSKDLRQVIDCLQAGLSVESCSSLERSVSGSMHRNTIELDTVGSGNVLEVLPFYDVQLTWLTRWTEDPANYPVEVTNEALRTDNAHSRGIAARTGGTGTSQVYASSHRGNIGLTDTDPIDVRFASLVTSSGIDVEATSNDPAGPDPQDLVAGTILSGVPGVQASKVDITANDAICNRTPDGFECWIAGASPTLTVSNYRKQNTNMAACSDTLLTTNQSITANNPTTTFSLAGGLGLGFPAGYKHEIYLAENSCPTS
jgi:prepilin-type N-terminal cleavage/methylation domain-containing protein